MSVHASEAELAEAFAEWDRRYRERPERFMPDPHGLTPESYGEACARHLVAILEDLAATRLGP